MTIRPFFRNGPILFGLIFLLGYSSWAQPTAEFDKKKNGSRAVLERMMRFVESKNTEAFASLMVYSGVDKGRDLKSRLNYNDPYEKVVAENMCMKMYSYWNKCVRYKFSNFRTATWAGNEMIFWDATFVSKKGKEKSYKLSIVYLKGNYWFWKVEDI